MDKTNLILDTSALIAYLSNEKEAAQIEKFIASSLLPFICLSELYYIIWNKKGRAQADKIYGIVKSWKLPVLFPNERVILNAGRVKAVYRLGISDSYIAAFCIEYNGKLITKDKDYKVLENEISLLMFER